MPGSPEQILDPEDALAVRTVLESEDHIAGLLGLTLGAATQSVNKEVERQANLELFQLLTSQYYQPILNILPQILAPDTPPPVREIVTRMIDGADEFLKRVLQSHQIFDWEKLLLSDDLGKLNALLAQQPPALLGGPPQPPGAPPMPPGPGNGAVPMQ